MSLRRVLCAFVAAASVSNAASTQTVTSVATATDAASTLTVTSTSTPSKTGHQTLEQPSREGPTPTLPSGFIVPNPTEGLPRIEVDFIIPQNTTYRRPENGIMPLALSVQNFAKFASMGFPLDTVTFSWVLFPQADGMGTPSGKLSLYNGTIGANATDSDSNVFIGYVNVTQFAHVTNFAIMVSSDWADNNATGVCKGRYGGGVWETNHLFFTLADSDGGDNGTTNGTTTPVAAVPSVGDAPDCPVLGMFVAPRTTTPAATTTLTQGSSTITAYSWPTGTCSVRIMGADWLGNPCEVTVAASDRSAMDTAILSMASTDAAYLAAHPIPTYTGKNAAPLMTGLPLLPVLAAGVAYGIVF